MADVPEIVPAGLAYLSFTTGITTSYFYHTDAFMRTVLFWVIMQ
jgi:hypothetical protein